MPTPLRKVSYLLPNNLTSKSKQYWSYYVPVFSWLPSYSFRLFAGDIAAGLTVRMRLGGSVNMVEERKAKAGCCHC